MPGGLLDQLAADDRQAVLRQMARRSYRKNETLFHAGDPGSTLHIIEKGHVAIRVSTPRGDVATLTVLGPGGSFGEQALINEAATRTASAVALDAVETRTLARSEFERLRQTSPAVVRFLVDALAGQVRRLSAQLLDALYVAADERVVRRLAEVAALYPADGSTVEVPIRQDDLASMAGTARPTANRVLKQLEGESIVGLTRGRIVVHDLEALRRRAR